MSKESIHTPSTRYELLATPTKNPISTTTNCPLPTNSPYVLETEKSTPVSLQKKIAKKIRQKKEIHLHTEYPFFSQDKETEATQIQISSKNTVCRTSTDTDFLRTKKFK